MKKTLKDYLFVGLQILLFVAFLIDFEVLQLVVSKGIRIAGGVLFFIGFLISVIGILQLRSNLSPFPSPKPGAYLVDTGLYKYARHPIYTGIVGAGIGLGLATASGVRLGLALLLWGLFYLKSQYEEERMVQAYPEYEEYRIRTGRFFPKSFRK